MQTQSYASIFEDIAETLTPENWRKGAYFREDQGQLCMCAHGALQARVNPEVKRVLSSSEVVPRSPTAMNGTMLTSASAEAEEAIRNNSSASPSAIWNLRSSWTRSDYFHKEKNYGKTEAHYLLGMVGLTISFNDAKDTTLKMVKEKFREAAQLAQTLNV